MHKISVYIMSIFYILSGISHFTHAQFYVDIVPGYLPYHTELVFISGVFEILLGMLLIFKNTRRYAAYGIIALLIAVFPANIQMMVNYYHESNSKLWISVLRLPIQILLIFWAYNSAKMRENNF